MPITCVGSSLSSRRTKCLAMIIASRVSSVSILASSSSRGFASVSMMACSAAILTSTSAIRTLSSASPLRTPSTWPALWPCSQASRSTAARCMTLTPPLPRGSGAPSTLGRSQRETSSAIAVGAGCGSDIFFAALAAERYGAFVGQLACREQDFLLRQFDVDEPHRTLVGQVVLHHLGRTLRHVLEDLGLERFVRALE